jgi:hypothetical protein
MPDKFAEGVALRLPKESKRYADGVPLAVAGADSTESAPPRKRAARKRTAKKTAAKTGQSATATTEES